MFGWLRRLFRGAEPKALVPECANDEVPDFILLSCLEPDRYRVGETVHEGDSDYVITELDSKNGVVVWERHGE